MTVSRPKTTKYNPSDPPPHKLISIGVSLITHEVHSFIQDDRHIEIPVDDEIVYLSVPYEVVNLPNGASDWNAIAKLIEQEKGLRRTHWKIMSVWSCVPTHIADEIF